METVKRSVVTRGWQGKGGGEQSEMQGSDMIAWDTVTMDGMSFMHTHSLHHQE